MDIVNRKIENTDDVEKFIKDVIWYYKIDFYEQIESSRKVLWNVKKSVNLCTPERLRNDYNNYNNREVSDEEIEKLQELEELCIEICNGDFNFAELVLEISEKLQDEELMRYDQDIRDHEDYVREANRQFNDMMNEHGAWGNID